MKALWKIEREIRRVLWGSNDKGKLIKKCQKSEEKKKPNWGGSRHDLQAGDG